MSYPAILPKFLLGSESIISPIDQKVGELMDFWRWAYSDLVGNTERGILAEFIVACALEIEKLDRIQWDSYDLKSPEDIKIEVKSSGYIQTWLQEKLSSLSFGIQPTLSWDSRTNLYGTEKRRQSDIYVFCILKHTDQETLNPLDISQWDFYLLPTAILNEKARKQKHISLPALIKLGAEKCEYQDLHQRIVYLIKGNQT